MKELENKTIGVFFGGQNPEHEVSIITGEFVIAELKRMGVRVVPVYVDKDGMWHSDEKLAQLKFFKDDYEQKLKDFKNLYLDLQSSKCKFVLRNNSLLNKKVIDIDFIFPTFHGLQGEDGTIQGMAEFFNVPYVGCGIYSSSISIDKVFTKSFFTSLDIPTTDFRTFNKQYFLSNKNSVLQEIKETFKFPVFVKPARSGSSIGITKVKDFKELEDALNLAFHYDIKILVENSVENIVDLTCAVLGYENESIVSEVQESLFKSDLFDYSVKYLEDGGAQTGNAESNLVIPANITNENTKKIKEYSQKIFKELNANGNVRIDFLLNKESGELFANEINTLPGTLYHHLWKKSGISMSGILEKMIAVGFSRWEETQKIQSDFDSSVLSDANSMKLQYNSGQQSDS